MDNPVDWSKSSTPELVHALGLAMQVEAWLSAEAILAELKGRVSEAHYGR